MTNSTRSYLKDKVPSKAKHLSSNLVLRSDSPQATFAISFIADAKPEILSRISEVATKSKKDVELAFTFKETPTSLAKHLSPDSKYQDYRELPVEVSNYLSSTIKNSRDTIVHYVNISFLGY